jgi:hypothetical protein
MPSLRSEGYLENERQRFWDRDDEGLRLETWQGWVIALRLDGAFATTITESRAGPVGREEPYVRVLATRYADGARRVPESLWSGPFAQPATWSGAVADDWRVALASSRRELWIFTAAGIDQRKVLRHRSSRSTLSLRT